ncbi:DUF2786 domain-containing protein [Frankia sp. Ag45/Mut15]|uniref:DUF2786 domain-containing protein n=1 Tax=Frankia umida TaxID=573489 RepID=A0ABT0JYY4_9ACTN|nr:DUF2786 domain-containing protein [Frankia umida]MCK9876748.1 DUF2786 domain-containing protein [Frankia umida]
MGSQSRERRKAKEKARANRARNAGTKPGPFGPPGPFGQAGPFGPPVPPRESLAELTEKIISDALTALLAEDDASFMAFLSALADPPNGPSGRRTVNKALVGWFDRALEGLWRRGWQPVDLHRIVGRQSDQRHVRLVLDAIAGQLRRYAPATVDERWPAQLSSLGAHVWWEHDDQWLDAWGEREGRVRVMVLSDAIELLRALHLLPEVEMLGPPPGTARRETSSRGSGPGSGPGPAGNAAASTGEGADTRILDKVRALLAKAESTEFTDEAEALTAKAQQLMARHSIDEALLAAGQGSREQPSGRRVGIDNPYEMAKATLLDVVADANRCRTVWSKHLGHSTVVGFEPDLDAVELLYTSLLLQATTAMTRAGSRQDRIGRSRTRSFRQSFLASFAMRIGERLRAASEQVRDEAVAEAGNSRLLPVLAARTDSVQAATTAMFPRITSRSIRASDGEGWASGRAAADLASLHTREEVVADRSR